MIKVIVYDSLIMISPWINNLKKDLTCLRKKSEYKTQKDGSKKLGTTKYHEKLYATTYTDDGREIGMVWPGLLPEIKQGLNRIGYEFKVIDEQSDVSEPDMSRLNLSNPRQGQLQALALMCSERHAIIEAPTGWGKTKLIEQFCRIYPKSRIVVITKKQNVRNSLYDRIKEANPNRNILKLTSGKHIQSDTDIVVAADKSLHKINEGWADILIYDEVHNAGAEDTCKKLNKFTNIRTYGLSATPEGRTDKSDLQVKALIGPIRMRIPYQVAQEDNAVAKIVVDMYPLELKSKGITSKFIKNTICIIRNTNRHKAIASTIRRIIPAEEQVLILVDKTEHALRLKPYLPGTYLAFRTINTDRINWFKKQKLLTENDETSPNVEQLKEQFKKGEITRLISTRIFEEGEDFPDLKWLVRADGLATSIGAIQMGGRVTRYKEGKIGRIISFIDYYDDLEWVGFKQIEHYEKKGWTVNKKTKLPKGELLW